MHLSDTKPEACCPATVLAQAVTGCHSASGSTLPLTLTFRAATQQLVAYLLTLHLPHARTRPAATPAHHTEDCEPADSSRACSSSGSSSCGSAGSSGVQCARPGPESIDDFLWWCEDRSSRRHGSSSSSCAMLDCAVSVLHDLLGLASHEEQLLHGTQWAEGAVMEVLREVSGPCRLLTLQAQHGAHSANP
jgi:hypothetical protein